MRPIARRVRDFLREDSGASAAEYAVLVAVIIVAVVGAVATFNLENIFGTVGNMVRGCVDNSTC